MWGRLRQSLVLYECFDWKKIDIFTSWRTMEVIHWNDIETYFGSRLSNWLASEKEVNTFNWVY